MKRKVTLLTGIGALLLLFAGCLVVSVYPYYNEKDLVFEPGLVGKWIKTDGNEHRD